MGAGRGERGGGAGAGRGGGAKIVWETVTETGSAAHYDCMRFGARAARSAGFPVEVASVEVASPSRDDSVLELGLEDDLTSIVDRRYSWATASNPLRSAPKIPPPPSTLLSCSAIPPPPTTALASCSAIPPPPTTVLASCSVVPPPPVTALASCSVAPALAVVVRRRRTTEQESASDGSEQDASAVTGGGGTTEQDASTVVGGGGMAEHEASAVVGGGGMAEHESKVLGGGGATLEPNEISCTSWPANIAYPRWTSGRPRAQSSGAGSSRLGLATSTLATSTGNLPAAAALREHRTSVQS